MSKAIIKPTFEYFCKGLIWEKDRLIALGQLISGKTLMAHSKKNSNKGFNKNHKPENTKGSTHHSSNDAPKKKVFNPCKYCRKTNHPEKS